MKNNHRSVINTAVHSKGANSRRIVVARAAAQEQRQQQQQQQHGAPHPHPQPQPATTSSRRHLTLGAAAAALAAGSSTRSAARAADEQPPFVETPSGLLVQDIRVGTGDVPRKGGRVSVHWSGYTKGVVFWFLLAEGAGVGAFVPAHTQCLGEADRCSTAEHGNTHATHHQNIVKTQKWQR
jgi:FKBP-type peptidyl-prolyl cis-trans isomerase